MKENKKIWKVQQNGDGSTENGEKDRELKADNPLKKADHTIFKAGQTVVYARQAVVDLLDDSLNAGQTDVVLGHSAFKGGNHVLLLCDSMIAPH